MQLDFTTHAIEIEFDRYNEPIYLLPFGDIHRFATCDGQPTCDVEKWHEFLEWAKTRERAYFLGMGDYDDFMSGSERLSLRHTNLHETSMDSIDSLMKDRAYKLADEMMFMKGRLVGLVEGNHHGVISTSGVTTTQLMAERLGCKYLGYSSFIRIAFKDKTSKGKRCSIDVWAHHGTGGGRSSGGSVNSVERMSQIALADVYLCGHDHRKWLTFKSILQLSSSGPRSGIAVHHKKILHGRTGSFLKSYVPNTKSYVAQAALPPSDLGTIKIEMTPRRERRDGQDRNYVDLHGGI